MKNNKLFSTLDVIPFDAYVIDIETFEVLYINKVLTKKVSNFEGSFCWEKIYGLNEKCTWCTISEFTKNNKISKNKSVIDNIFNESSDTWIQTYDEIITLSNGKYAKCTIAVDITKQKEIQASLIQAHIKLVRQAEKLKEINQKYEQLAKTDYLTGINNRRNFFCLGESAYLNNTSSNKKLYVAIFDLDKFKQLNDTYGHHIGDKALIEFSKKVQKNLDKKSDIFGRLGGEEFALIMESTGEDEILYKVEKIRKSIEKITLKEKSQKINFTVSIGLVKKEISETLDMTLERADKLLYEAKESGRNQTKFRS